jgi:hypothetical protein
MKSLPFSAAMMRANLAGTKTETRRMPKKNGKPRFAVGELGYAQEAWRVSRLIDLMSPSEMTNCEPIFYEASILPDCPRDLGRKRASMHLPERFTRFKFRVLECEFQKLHDITHHQAIAEGVLFRHGRYQGAEYLPSRIHALSAYGDLWEHINGYGSWEANPLIERIRYERIPL